jgi:hypothetical protein
MNAPPPVGTTLPIKVESGDPVLVKFTYQGQGYVIRISTSVLAVWPTGAVGPDGLPLFNIQMAPRVFGIEGRPSQGDPTMNPLMIIPVVTVVVSSPSPVADMQACAHEFRTSSGEQAQLVALTDGMMLLITDNGRTIQNTPVGDTPQDIADHAALVEETLADVEDAPIGSIVEQGWVQWSWQPGIGFVRG